MTTVSIRRFALCCFMLSACGLLTGCPQTEDAAAAVTIVPSAQSPHQVGRYCAADKTMVAAPGEKGYLSFGPYAKLKTGLYEAIFDVSVQGAVAKAVTVDINAFDPNHPIGIVGSADISQNGSNQRLALRFKAMEGPKYEFRVGSDGSSTVRLSGITVKRIE